MKEIQGPFITKQPYLKLPTQLQQVSKAFKELEAWSYEGSRDILLEGPISHVEMSGVTGSSTVVNELVDLINTQTCTWGLKQFILDITPMADFK